MGSLHSALRLRKLLCAHEVIALTAACAFACDEILVLRVVLLHDFHGRRDTLNAPVKAERILRLPMANEARRSSRP